MASLQLFCILSGAKTAVWLAGERVRDRSKDTRKKNSEAAVNQSKAPLTGGENVDGNISVRDLAQQLLSCAQDQGWPRP